MHLLIWQHSARSHLNFYELPVLPQISPQHI